MEHSHDRNAAVHFHPADYGFSELEVMGRVSASRSFLEGFLSHSEIETAYCYAKSKRHFAQFEELARAIRGPQTTCQLIEFGETEKLAGPGCLYRPDPSMATPAWQRRLGGRERQYSLCGITHTICTGAAIDALADLLVAPVHSWDALICTSQSAHDTVMVVYDRWRDYLADRLRALPTIPFLTPVIPLGIDCDAISTKPDSKRNRLQKYVREDETLVVYVGRLSHTKKAHPLAMFLALQEAFRKTQKKIHLFLVGWFKDPAHAEAFQALGRESAPDVRVTAVDGNKPSVVADAWKIADIFISLVDNVQETFGLTPIEAMAAGVPVVVSDWNGYKETVRHGVDGFRVPTTVPPAGAGDLLAEQYGCQQISYEQYVASTALCCAIDIGRCADYLATLIDNPQLRHQLGEAGRRRARERYDWRVIIPQYQQLWAELTERRQQAERNSSGDRPAIPHPLRQDPFTVFGRYASGVICNRTRLELVSENPKRDLQRITDHGINLPAAKILAPRQEILALLQILRRGSPQLEEFLATKRPEEHAVWFRTIVWLAKMGLIRLISPGTAVSNHQQSQ